MTKASDHFLRRHRLSAGLISLVALGAIAAACSDAGDRANRAKAIFEGAGDQISGEAIVDADPAANLSAASVLDRAIGGTDRNDMTFSSESFTPMFVAGSIIAKPAGISEPPAAAIIEGDEYYIEDLEVLESLPEAVDAVVDDVPAGSGTSDPAAGASPEAPPMVGASPKARTRSLRLDPSALPTIELDPDANEKTLRDLKRAETDMKEEVSKEPKSIKRTRSLRPREMRPLDSANEAEVRKLARRSVLTTEVVDAQIDANEIMLNTLRKFDLQASVQPSIGGSMVIQLGPDGASPTQLTAEQVQRAPLDFLALEEKGGCADPSNLDEIRKNAALATECVIDELRKTGEFEYVEKDYIFQNQFFRRPREPATPPTTTPPSSGTNGGTTGSTGTTPTTTPTPPTGPVTITPNDPLWALQWHFKNVGTGVNQSAGGAGFQDFWSRQGTEGSREIIVAVVDTGLQLNHPDIKDSPNVAQGWDMVSDPRTGNDGDGRDGDPNDPGDLCELSAFPEDTFHGTHVAGTIGAAATNNGSGVAGGAWQVKIVPVRALGKCGGSLSDINDAIRWAGGLIDAVDANNLPVRNENPADIINLSIGLLRTCPASLQDAINAVTERGAIVVSAAGNAKISTSLYAPGGCENVISVAAGDARGQIAPYSNFGAEVDLLAPGGDLTRDDNADGRPDGVLSTKAAKNCYDPVTGEGVDACYYAYEQGTSMAAPHVSAALALLKARTPSASNEDIIAALLAASDVRAPEQCAGLCAQYPGTEPIPGSADMCRRPCGVMLNLAKVPVTPSGGGGRGK